ncbi:hypothetical protein AALP_AA2G155700 [Arabis alpina]|uniref:RING-type E3 ubiquitin transferase n=1 Tax=Arabis alpina TaxID=50452 RepID=A0A087HHQ3_ARAAL|nr:hypothetical protein AALP_AA2G155700 [Arabis alpina]
MLASETNKTLDCSIGICDSICPYNCYSEPDYHTISPHLPPRSSPRPITSPSPSPSPSISAIYQPSQNSSSSSSGAITIITVTGAALAILLTGFFLVAKFVSKSVNRVNNRPERDNYSVDEEFQDREQEEVDHPIWFIRTTDDESLRLLPKCNHAFHISCIDTWLRSHTNCPLCRAGIAMISVVTPRISGQVDVSSGGSGSRLENDQEDQDLGQIENRVELGREIDESETETQEKVRVFEDCNDSNGGGSIDSVFLAKTHQESVDFPGKSSENRSQDLTKEDIEKENRDMGDEDDGGHKVLSRRSYDSGESSGEASEDTSNTSKTTGSSSVSFFNTNKSSVFPMS